MAEHPVHDLLKTSFHALKLVQTNNKINIEFDDFCRTLTDYYIFGSEFDHSICQLFQFFIIIFVFDRFTIRSLVLLFPHFAQCNSILFFCFFCFNSHVNSSVFLPISDYPTMNENNWMKTKKLHNTKIITNNHIIAH